MKLRIPTIALFSVVVALPLSCAGGSSGDQTIDNVFDACEPLVLVPDGERPAELDSMEEAAALWNGRANTKLIVDSGGDVDENAASLPVKFDDAAGAFHGHYDDENSVIYINHDLEGRGRAITIAHEVGHAFGLMHVPAEERASLMNSGNMESEVTDGDIAALAELWGECP